MNSFMKTANDDVTKIDELREEFFNFEYDMVESEKEEFERNFILKYWTRIFANKHLGIWKLTLRNYVVEEIYYYNQLRNAWLEVQPYTTREIETIINNNGKQTNTSKQQSSGTSKRDSEHSDVTDVTSASTTTQESKHDGSSTQNGVEKNTGKSEGTTDVDNTGTVKTESSDETNYGEEKNFDYEYPAGQELNDNAASKANKKLAKTDTSSGDNTVTNNLKTKTVSDGSDVNTRVVEDMQTVDDSSDSSTSDQNGTQKTVGEGTQKDVVEDENIVDVNGTTVNEGETITNVKGNTETFVKLYSEYRKVVNNLQYDLINGANFLFTSIVKWPN